ncbi:MAG: hypothetical protein KatS3mg111_3011 [Pirellulaceae bacterium]|nr:MAG: hypothetical protein KatS3mg111_3011 [Pirellulaceae bacterium]
MAQVFPKFSRRRVSTERRVRRRVEPALGVRLLTLQPRVEPLELLEFEYRIQRVELDDVERVEVSVMWYTEGKGTTDIGVHYFESLSQDEVRRLLHCNARTVATTLPGGPLSYEGRLLKIRWCVRLRLYLKDGREFTAEHPFHVGHVDPAANHDGVVSHDG